MAIWVPDGMYRMLPWLCIMLGTVALLLPAGLVVAACVAYLYGYAGVILLRRWREYCMYN